FPFLCQHPNYVTDQYEKWFDLLRAEDRTKHMYRDAWHLIELYGAPVSRKAYLILQLASGAGIAALCWQRQRAGWSSPALLTSTLALTMAWTMLLGPATESSSFALLAPSFAWSIVEALQTKTRGARHGLLWGSCALFAIAVIVGGIVMEWKIHETGVHAWASLCYFAYLVIEPRASAVQEMQVADSRRAAA